MDEKRFFDINDYVDELTKSTNRMTSKMLLQDIIMVYNGCYGETYSEYLEIIAKANEKVREMRKMDMHSFSTTLVFVPYHNILEQFQFDYIKELRGLYEPIRKD